MSRSLLVLAAVAAASVWGIWLHAARTPVPQRIVTTGAAIRPAATFRSPAHGQPVVGARKTALASTPGTSTPPGRRRVSRTGSMAATAGMKVAADPVTGQIVTPEYSGAPLSIAEMQALARREAEGLVTVHNPDGSETLNHQGHFADFTIVRAGPDGRPVFVCVQGRAAAAKATRAGTTVQPQLEDR
jgi:hypothetical protein